MKYMKGVTPTWKERPHRKSIDDDVEFLILRNAILTGQLKPFEQAVILVHESTDGPRLGTKNPARYVRSHLLKTLRKAGLEPDYVVEAKRTNNPGEWGVLVTHEPRETVVGRTREARLAS